MGDTGFQNELVSRYLPNAIDIVCHSDPAPKFRGRVRNLPQNNINMGELRRVVGQFKFKRSLPAVGMTSSMEFKKAEGKILHLFII